jgi:hypothetical protein
LIFFKFEDQKQINESQIVVKKVKKIKTEEERIEIMNIGQTNVNSKSGKPEKTNDPNRLEKSRENDQSSFGMVRDSGLTNQCLRCICNV